MAQRGEWRDRWVWMAVLVAVVLRAAPLLLWGWSSGDCTRDECIFKIVTNSIIDGDGLGLAPKRDGCGPALRCGLGKPVESHCDQSAIC